MRTGRLPNLIVVSTRWTKGALAAVRWVVHSYRTGLADRIDKRRRVCGKVYQLRVCKVRAKGALAFLLAEAVKVCRVAYTAVVHERSGRTTAHRRHATVKAPAGVGVGFVDRLVKPKACWIGIVIVHGIGLAVTSAGVEVSRRKIDHRPDRNMKIYRLTTEFSSRVGCPTAVARPTRHKFH